MLHFPPRKRDSVNLSESPTSNRKIWNAIFCFFMILLKMRFLSIALLLFFAVAICEQQDIEVNAEQSTLNQPSQESVFDVHLQWYSDVGTRLSLREGICRSEGQL